MEAQLAIYGYARVSEDIAVEVLQRATATDHDLPEATMAFIERHAAFEKKPPAPSGAWLPLRH